jgi:hypothetical protein
MLVVRLSNSAGIHNFHDSPRPPEGLWGGPKIFFSVRIPRKCITSKSGALFRLSGA